jgi:hypothetical protein
MKLTRRGVMAAGLRLLCSKGDYELWGWLEFYFESRHLFRLGVVVLFGLSAVSNGGWCKILLPDDAWKAVGPSFTLDGDLEDERLVH